MSRGFFKPNREQKLRKLELTANLAHALLNLAQIQEETGSALSQQKLENAAERLIRILNRSLKMPQFEKKKPSDNNPNDRRTKLTRKRRTLQKGQLLTNHKQKESTCPIVNPDSSGSLGPGAIPELL